MAETVRFVLDASVALRWYLRDEPYRKQALQVADDLAEGKLLLLGPSLIYSEVTGGLRNATRAAQQRISDAEGRAALNDFFALDLRITPLEGLALEAYAVSRRYGCSAYDAFYLALSDLTQSPIIHADGKLRRALGARFPLEVWIEDYQGVA